MKAEDKPDPLDEAVGDDAGNIFGADEEPPELSEEDADAELDEYLKNGVIDEVENGIPGDGQPIT